MLFAQPDVTQFWTMSPTCQDRYSPTADQKVRTGGAAELAQKVLAPVQDWPVPEELHVPAWVYAVPSDAVSGFIRNTATSVPVPVLVHDGSSFS